MEGELQPPRFFSCRGVSFEINRKNSTPLPPVSTNTIEEPHNDNPAAPHPLDDRRCFSTFSFSLNYDAPDRLPAELLVSSPSRAFSGNQSHASSHFCDIDGGEEYEYLPPSGASQLHDIEDLLLPQPPPKKASKAPKTQESRLSVILLDQGLLTVYKRLFALCFAVNLLGLVVAATGHFPYAKEKTALFSMGNILASVLCRSEAFLRCVFWLAVNLLGSRSWVPLAVKCAATSFLQALGGIHSSCGISSIMWLIYSLVQTLSHRKSSSDEIIGVASAILVLLLVSSFAAFPLVRLLHHNLFERFHRFAGWAALVMLWAFVILTTSYNPLDKSYNVRGSSLVEKQECWFTLAITLIIIFPWFCLRRVPVKVFAPSNHGSLIKFGGGIKSGMMGRISRSPLSEWHTFGIISEGKGEHMMLAGAVGDFTRGLISDPPTHLWVRNLRFAGLPYLINMYKKVVVVATGSGICVFLSFLLQPCSADVYVIWVAKGIEQNFGDEIVRMVKNYPSEKMIIHDTAVWGRPNVAEMTVKEAKRWGGEVVIVTSNPSGSRDVVNGCKAEGIPAFGPIWDS